MPLNRHVAASATDSTARPLMVSTLAGRGIQLELYDRMFTHEVTNGPTNQCA